MPSKDRTKAIERAIADKRTYDQNEWRPIPGMPEYEASISGLIARVAPAKTHATPRILRYSDGHRGHKRCRMLQNGKRIAANVARLLLCTWVGPPPTQSHHACHNDGNPANNDIRNLRWDTCKGNLADRNSHGTSLHGSRNGRAKMTWNSVRQMRNEYDAGVSVAELSKKYKLASSQTREICRKESWWPDAEQQQ